MTIQSRAQELSAAFERRTRNNDAEYVCLKDGSPEWMTDAIRAAHRDGSPGINGEPGQGFMFPDDWRYALIERAADALAENEDEESARDALEPDVYTGRLTDWLASRADRHGYCDEAMEEYGSEFRGTFALLQLGQQWELEEVFGELLQALQELESEDADEDDES